MLPLVYIAGPYSKPDPVENTHLSIKKGMELYRTGLMTVLIPHVTLMMHLIEPHELQYWYDFDLTQIPHCTAVYRLPGDSSGADTEVEFARSIGLPVFTDEEALLAWAADQAPDSE